MNGSALRPELEAIVLRFENAWQSDEAPELIPFSEKARSRAASDHERVCVLAELAAVDLEYRWKRFGRTVKNAFSCSERVYPVEQYLDTIPELQATDDVRLRLLAETYRACRLWGCSDVWHQFRKELKEDRGTGRLRELLHHVDADIAADQVPGVARPQVRGRIVEGSDPRAPLSYSDFLLQRQIGAGGMGKVYASHQRSLDRQVAVKFLRRSLLDYPEAADRFLAEARAIARVRHSSIVGIHGTGRTPGGGYFIVMDLIDGEDLSSKQRRRPIGIADALRWTIQVADGISAAHEHGIVHCDLKPSNVIIDSKGSAWITDFGLARGAGDSTFVATGLEGTAAFMAPEQIDAAFGPVSERTAVYGLGGLLYATLCGVPPRPETHPTDIMAATVAGVPFPSITEFRDDVEVAIDVIVERCLARNSADRFGSASELADSLRGLAENVSP